MPPSAPKNPAEELEAVLELDEEGIRLRQWRERQMVTGGIGEFAAMRLSFAGTDYRRAVHLHDLGMSDDLILDQLLD